MVPEVGSAVVPAAPSLRLEKTASRSRYHAVKMLVWKRQGSGSRGAPASGGPSERGVAAAHRFLPGNISTATAKSDTSPMNGPMLRVAAPVLTVLCAAHFAFTAPQPAKAAYADGGAGDNVGYVGSRVSGEQDTDTFVKESRFRRAPRETALGDAASTEEEEHDCTVFLASVIPANSVQRDLRDSTRSPHSVAVPCGVADRATRKYDILDDEGVGRRAGADEVAVRTIRGEPSRSPLIGQLSQKEARRVTVQHVDFVYGGDGSSPNKPHHNLTQSRSRHDSLFHENARRPQDGTPGAWMRRGRAAKVKSLPRGNGEAAGQTERLAGRAAVSYNIAEGQANAELKAAAGERAIQSFSGAAAHLKHQLVKVLTVPQAKVDLPLKKQGGQQHHLKASGAQPPVIAEEEVNENTARRERAVSKTGNSAPAAERQLSQRRDAAESVHRLAVQHPAGGVTHERLLLPLSSTPPGGGQERSHENIGPRAAVKYEMHLHELRGWDDEGGDTKRIGEDIEYTVWQERATLGASSVSRRHPHVHRALPHYHVSEHKNLSLQSPEHHDALQRLDAQAHDEGKEPTTTSLRLGQEPKEYAARATRSTGKSGAPRAVSKAEEVQVSRKTPQTQPGLCRSAGGALRQPVRRLQAEPDATVGTQAPLLSNEAKAALQQMQQQQLQGVQEIRKELQKVREEDEKEENNELGRYLKAKESLLRRVGTALEQQEAEIQGTLTSWQKKEALAGSGEVSEELHQLQQQQKYHLARVQGIREELKALQEEVKAADDKEPKQRAEREQALRIWLEAAVDRQESLLQADAEAAEKAQMSGLSDDTKAELQRMQQQQQTQLDRVRKLREEVDKLWVTREREEDDASRKQLSREKRMQERVDSALEKQKARIQKQIESLEAQEAQAKTEEAKEELRRLQEEQNEHLAEVQEMGDELEAVRENLRDEEDEGAQRRAAKQEEIRRRMEDALEVQEKSLEAELETIKEAQASELSGDTKAQLQQMQRYEQEQLKRVHDLQKELRSSREKQEKEEADEQRRQGDMERSMRARVDAALEEREAEIEREVESLRVQEALAAGEEERQELRQLERQQSEHMAEVQEMGEELRALREELRAQKGQGARRRAEAAHALRTWLEAAMSRQASHLQAELKTIKEKRISGIQTQTKAEMQQMQRLQDEQLKRVHDLQKELQAVRKAREKEEDDKARRRLEMEKSVQKRVDTALEQQKAEIQKEIERLKAHEALAGNEQTMADLYRLQQQQNEHLARVKDMGREFRALREQLRAEEDEGARRRAEGQQALRAWLENAMSQQGRALQEQLEAVKETQMSGLSDETKAELQQMQQNQQEQLERVQALQKELQAVRDAQESRENDKLLGELEMEKSVQERIDAALEQQKAEIQKELQSLQAHEALAAGEEAKEELRRLQQQQNEHLARVQEMGEEFRALRDELKDEEEDGSRRRAEREQELRTWLEAAMSQQGRILQAELEAVKETQRSALSSKAKAELQQMQQRQQEQLHRMRELQKELRSVREAQEKEEDDESRREEEMEKTVRERVDAALERQRAEIQKELDNLRSHEALAAGEEAKEEMRRLQQQQNEHLAQVQEMREEFKALREELREEEDEGARQRAETEQALRTWLEAAMRRQGRLLQEEREELKRTQLAGLSSETKAELQQMQQHQEAQLKHVETLQKELQTLRQAQKKEQDERTRRHLRVEQGVQERVNAALEEQKGRFQTALDKLKAQVAAGSQAKAELRRLQQQQNEHLSSVKEMGEEIRALREELKAEEDEESRRRVETDLALRTWMEGVLSQQERSIEAELKAIKETAALGKGAEAKAELQQIQQDQLEHMQRLQEVEEELQAVQQAQERMSKDKPTREAEISTGSDDHGYKAETPKETPSVRGRVDHRLTMGRHRRLQQEHRDRFRGVTETSQQLRAL